jgi:putative transposase
LHKVSKDIVQNAKQSKSMIIFENLKGIRKLYRKGNGQGNKFRRKLNSWSFYELQRQVEYKARWEGIPVKFIDPKCTSKLCPRCGKRLQEDRQRRRDLWCGNCKRWQDRDVVAAMNIAYKGWTRFIHPQGVVGEAMVQECGFSEPLILKVDATKLRVKGYQSSTS